MYAETPLQRARCAHGDFAWRESGSGRPLVLLHGIGSGSGSWAAQLASLAASFRVIAWDAPGYGGSAPLPDTQPLARDYAAALDALLDRLQVREPIVVGHSLGAIVGAAWTARAQSRPPALLLASPARGYGAASAAQREAKYRERVELVERLGIAGIAAQRSAALCAPGAPADAVERVRANMALATPGGYLQAAHMLAHDDLLAQLRGLDVPLAVLCGEHDTVTPPSACEAIARELSAPFTLLRGVAHACYVEDPAQFDAALLAFVHDAAAKANHA